MYKTIYKLGCAVYLLFLLMSIVLYKERIIFLDTTLFTFNMLRTGSFTIEHYRFIAVFTELLPLIATKLSVSLSGVLTAYSFGFAVCYFICYLLCGSVFKKYHYAVALLVCNALIITETFYWPISELPLGVSLLITLMAYMEYKELKQPNALHYMVLAVFMVTLAFAHPLILFPASFGFLYLFFSTGERKYRLFYIVAGMMFAVGIGIKMTFFKEAYDSTAMQSVRNFKTLFPNYIDLESNRSLLRAFTTKYYWIPIGSLTVMAAYIYKRDWMKLALFVCYLIGYIMLINICYPASNAAYFYQENLYLPLGAIIGIPLVLDALPAIRIKHAALVITSLIVITCIGRIYDKYSTYDKRLTWMRGYMKANEGRKLMVHASKIPLETMIMAWGSPYEFWLLSTMELGSSASILFYDDPGIEWEYKQTKAMSTTWGPFQYTDLDKRYFKFTDTTAAYQLIK